MTGMSRIATSILVALLFLVLQGFVNLHAMEHASQDAHHKAAAHGTSACSSMCAAGHVFHALEEPILAEQSPVALVDPSVELIPPDTESFRLSSRGPPASDQH